MEKKLEKMKEILKEMEKIVVAYSGGVDSTFLLKVALDTLGKENVIAVNAISETYPESEKKQAEKIAKKLGVNLVKIRTEELKDERFTSNPPDRCYWCKLSLFKELEEIRKKYGMKFIVDGTNKDDEKDFRPGERAKKTFNVRSPIKEAEIGKDEIRKYLKKTGLSVWNKPPMACLASRIPYGEKITLEKLKRIEKGEEYLKKNGFKLVRLRDYGNMVRIEVEKKYLEKLIQKREEIVKELKKLGYNYVTVDLEGYRTGSMNEIL